MPAADSAHKQKPTRGPKKRSSRKPVSSLPQKLAKPNREAARAAFAAGTPRSVSSGERCVMAPFMLTELRNRVPIRIQKGGGTQAFGYGGARRWRWNSGGCRSRGRSRTKSAVSGSPRSSTSAPSTKVRCAPSVPGNQGLRDGREHHGARTDAGHHQCQRQAATSVEPRGDGARIAHLGRAISDDAQQYKNGVEMRQARGEESE